jgi:hypothetical protein
VEPHHRYPEWKKAITFYVDFMKVDGRPPASANGFNENLTLLAALWIDAIGHPMLFRRSIWNSLGSHQKFFMAHEPKRNF